MYFRILIGNERGRTINALLTTCIKQFHINYADGLGLATLSFLVLGSNRPPQNHLPEYPNQIPNSIDYLDRGLPNHQTTRQPYPYPLNTPTIFQPQPDKQQLINAQTQHRTFLLTTLLPICVIIVILLAVALAIIWFLKCRKGNSRRDRKLQGIENEGGGSGVTGDGDEPPAPERVPLKEDKKALGKKNGITIANNGNEAENRTPRKSSKS